MSYHDWDSTESSPLLKSVDKNSKTQTSANTSDFYRNTTSSNHEEMSVTDNINHDHEEHIWPNPSMRCTISGTNQIANNSIQGVIMQEMPKERNYHSNNQSAIEDEECETEDTPLINKGPIVVCRVCEAEISLHGKINQHVIRCQHCREVTPIKAAPPGKKYVRCPCNCLLICKAGSTRIACPRPNCRRVITLAASSPIGTAVRAPPGTCRVQCAHCTEIFMFNALNNTLAHCPHCKNCSSVGSRFARTRATISFIVTILFTLVLAGLIFTTNHNGGTSGLLVYIPLVLLSLMSIFFFYRFVYYLRMKISQVLGPI